ncbi:hypothetical protein [Catenulispora sp. GAS73]|uniref:hypothetical protein n=1 Tax=Catenulispora sp. GAS73 TaxID=3156269 RepID=UPI003511BD3B
MVTTPKSRIHALANRLYLSDSYGALLHLTALMDSDPRTLVPKSEEERLSWEGHMLGLVSALHCVAMHEQQWEPHIASEIVDSLLNQARYILQEPAHGTGV